MLTDFQRVCYPDSEKQPAERLSVNLFDKEKIRDALLSHVANVLQIKTGSNAIPSRDAVRTIPVDAKLHRFQHEETNRSRSQKTEKQVQNKPAQGKLNDLLLLEKSF